MEKKRVTAFVEPQHIDSDSSPTTVYINKNVVKTIDTKLVDGEFVDYPVFTYDQYKYTRAEFELVEQFIENDEKMDIIVNKYDKRISILEQTIADLSDKINKLNK